MKKLLSLLLIICSISVAYADDKSTVTSLKYVDDQLATRQNKFGANDGKAMTFTNVAGGNAPRDVKTNLGSNTSDTGLPTVGAVNAGLDDKQNTIPAVNANTVITYTGTEGQIGQKGIYQDTGTYAAQSDNLIDAGTFNAALRNGLENEFVCADRDPVSGNCWLYTIDNVTTDNTLLPSGYTPLEYIETDGNVILDTQYIVQTDDVLELHYKMLPANMSKSGDKMLLYSSNTWAETFTDGNTPSRWYVRFLSPSSRSIDSDESQYQGVLILKKNTFIVNGVMIFDNLSSNLDSGNLTLSLFGRNGVTGTSIVQSAGFKITRNNQIVMNLLPARRDSDGEIGMYDTVSDRFFAKTGSGAFTPGPVANLYIPQNQTAQNQ